MFDFNGQLWLDGVRSVASSDAADGAERKMLHSIGAESPEIFEVADSSHTLYGGCSVISYRRCPESDRETRLEVVLGSARITWSDPFTAVQPRSN